MLNSEFIFIVYYHHHPLCNLNRQSYGFLPFDSYRLLSPTTAKIIYILSDSPHRANEGAICKVILTALLDFLEPLFPKASIVLLRGGTQ